MSYTARFQFSKNEGKIIKHLTPVGVRPRDLMRSADIAHASLYLAFKKLVARGFAERVVRSGRIYWRRTNNISEIEGLARSVKVAIYSTRQSVKDALYDVLQLTEGERIYIVEGTQTDSGWFDLFTKKETVQLNRFLASRKLISEVILPDTFFNDAVGRLGMDWQESFRRRPMTTTLLKKEDIVSNAILIVARHRALVVYAKEPLAIEIQNKEAVALITGMVRVIQKLAQC